MIRTQIQLTEDQAQKLKGLAAREGVSMAELIRRSIDDHLARVGSEDRRKRALSAVGGYRSGKRDIAERHDDYLDDAYSA